MNSVFAKVFMLMTFFLSFGNPSEADSAAKKENNMYHKEYYETGKTKAEGWVYKGVKNGYWRLYHPNGQLSEKGYYKNNQRIKYWHFYSQRGLRAQEGHYQNGKKTNWWLFYDANGRINHKCQLSAGFKNGYCLTYSSEKLTSAEKYKNGKKIKEWYSLSSFKRENNLSDLK